MAMSNIPWRFLVGPIVVLLIFAIGYPVYWHFAADRLEQGIAAWFDARRDKGWSVSHGAAVPNGFPLALRLTLPEFTLAADPAGWRWRSDAAVLEFQPWNWRRFRVVPEGAQTVALHFDGDWRRFRAEIAESAFIGQLDGDLKLAEGALQLRDMTLLDTGGRVLSRVGALRLWLRTPARQGSAANTSRSLTLRLSDAEITEKLHTPFGQNIARLDFDVRLRGGVPRNLGVAEIDEWRRGGGAVDIEALDLRWGPVGLRAAGTLMLDPNLRPAGSLQTELQGYAETLAALEGARLIRRRDAVAAHAVLDLLAQQGPEGSRVVALPLAAQDGALYLGPLRVFRLPPIPSLVPSAQTTRPGASR